MLHDKQTIITVDNQQKINSVNKWICWVFSWQTSTLRFFENPELAMYFQIHFPVTLRRGIVATLWCNIDLLDIAAIINTYTLYSQKQLILTVMSLPKLKNKSQNAGLSVTIKLFTCCFILQKQVNNLADSYANLRLFLVANASVPYFDNRT